MYFIIFSRRCYCSTMRNKTIFVVFVSLISLAMTTYLLLFHESQNLKDDKGNFKLQIRKLEKEVEQLLQFNENILEASKNNTNNYYFSSKNVRLNKEIHNINHNLNLKGTLSIHEIDEKYPHKTSRKKFHAINFQEAVIKTTLSSQSPIIAILVISCNRVTVKRCLDRLVEFRPDEKQFPIIVSQDCGHQETSNVIKSYGNKIFHIQLPDQSEIDIPLKEKKFKGYFKIARHYGWALNETFKQGFEAVVIVEDDLDVAPDFFEYFLGTYPILKADSTLWCVSAWNDNGKTELIDSQGTHLLYRTDFFPGLGWMLTKNLWMELSPKWPKSYWDDWIRQPEQRKNRACIRPEVSRTRTFGKIGVSKTVIGLKGKDAVVFAVEKIITSKLYEPYTNKRMFNVDRHIGMAISGLISDARQIVETSRLEAANYRVQYGIGIPLKYLNDRISMYMHAYTLYSSVRPYGCSIILSAYEDNNPEMYMIDPSGVSYGYYGCAIGKAKQSAKTEIEKLKLSTMDHKELVKEAARIIYLIHDELKDKQFELEMSWVGKHTNGIHEAVPIDIKNEAENKASQALAEESDSDTEEM